MNCMQGVVYKIRCNTPTITDVYIGSTSSFEQRIKQHKLRCCNKEHPKHMFLVYRVIREFGGFENWTFEILENINFNSRKELLLKEQYYHEIFNPKLNIMRAYVDPLLKPKLYYSENILNEKKRKAKYYLENKQLIKDRIMNYRLENPEKYKQIKEIDKQKSIERRKIKHALALLQMVD